MSHPPFQTHDLQRLQVIGDNVAIMTVTYTGVTAKPGFPDCPCSQQATIRSRSFPANSVETVQCEGGFSCFHKQLAPCEPMGGSMRLMDHPDFQVVSITNQSDANKGYTSSQQQQQQQQLPLQSSSMERTRGFGRSSDFKVGNVQAQRCEQPAPVEATVEGTRVCGCPFSARFCMKTGKEHTCECPRGAIYCMQTGKPHVKVQKSYAADP